MSVTPKLSTAIRSRIERRDRQAQTVFPGRVTKWSSSTNTVDLEPQFIETWVDRDGVRRSEVGDATVSNVPVCYPWHITWDITVGAFGLVICTKYSLDQWRQQLRRMDPGDLRRFTMSGATFHPVVIGESPNATQQFIALANLVDQELTDIKTYLDAHTHPFTPAGPSPTSAPTNPMPAPNAVGSATVKVSE